MIRGKGEARRGKRRKHGGSEKGKEGGGRWPDRNGGNEGGEKWQKTSGRRAKKKARAKKESGGRRRRCCLFVERDLENLNMRRTVGRGFCFVKETVHILNAAPPKFFPFRTGAYSPRGNLKLIDHANHRIR